MAKMSSARFVAETLKGYGVSHLFMVPAVLNPIVAAMEDLGITRVTTHSELSMAYMADGYARAARKPAVCFAQAVGAANTAAGLRDAFLAQSPVIAVTGSATPDTRYRYLYQQIEDFPMFDPVTKFNARVENPERVPDLLRQAFRVATTGSPGPVHLEAPGRFGQGIVGDGDFEVLVEEAYTRYPVHRPEPDAASILAVARALESAAKPVIVAGGGVSMSGAGRELVRLAERLSIPVVTSLNGKETILDNHPLCIGLVGNYGRWCANRLVAEADLVFFVGSRAGDMTTDYWQAPAPGTPVVQLDVDPEEIGRNYPAKAGIMGDAKVSLARLVEAVEPGAVPSSRAAWADHARGMLQKWRSQMAAMMGSDASPIRPERICQEISNFLPPDGVMVVDTGHSAIWSGTLVGLTSPDQRYIRCAGTLGWAFPAAIGAKCALPDHPVLCFTGDGGMFYHMPELETAARLGINVVVLVNNNGALSQTAPGFARAYGGRTDLGREMWVFRHTNFAALAESLGCLGIRVERPGDIRPALERAFAANRPAVVDVVSDVDAFPVGPWG